MSTARRSRRHLAAGFLVVITSVGACDLVVGPPVQDIGYEHNVGGPALPGYCGQVVRNGSSPKCSRHSSRLRSRPAARQAASTACPRVGSHT